jgi:CheY-like chemotaxis protein
MPKSGPIVIVEDDKDDQELFQDILKEIGVQNELLFFVRCSEAYHYLKTTPEQPFIIISDVNLPEQNGVEFKRSIDEDPELRQKSIPFVFLSTSVEKKLVDTAYKEMTVQGFFQKKPNYGELKSVLRMIVEYWKECRHPNS